MKGPRIVGRYELLLPLAAGGMATVHLGRQQSALGFERTVAIKQLHQHYAEDPDLVCMLLDEARIVSRIRHANVVPTLDVVAEDGEVLVVMEYVEGETLAHLLRLAKTAGARPAPGIILAVVGQLLAGLHAAHEATDATGRALGVVHRDVSPQNLIVGADGVSRVLDFGIAKAVGRSQTTQDGQVKGKLRYMAPEQIRGRRDVDRRLDVYAAAVVAWESLTGARLIDGDEAEIFGQLLDDHRVMPSFESVGASPLPRVETVLRRALSVDREARQASAAELADDLARAHHVASSGEVAAWVSSLASERLQTRASRLREAELGGIGVLPAPARPADDLASRPALRDEATAITTSGQTSDTPREAVQTVPKARRVLPVAVALTVTLGAVVGALALGRPTTTPSGGATGVGAPTTSTVASESSATEPPPRVDASVASDAERTAPSATAGTPKASTDKSVVRAKDPRLAPPRGPCDPPFTMVGGIKKYKRECVR